MFACARRAWDPERGGRNVERGGEESGREKTGEIIEKDGGSGGDTEGRKGGHREQIGERGRKKEGSGCFPKAWLFSQSSSSLTPPCDADTKRWSDCLYNQTKHRPESSHFIGFVPRQRWFWALSAIVLCLNGAAAKRRKGRKRLFSWIIWVWASQNTDLLEELAPWIHFHCRLFVVVFWIKPIWGESSTAVGYTSPFVSLIMCYFLFSFLMAANPLHNLTRVSWKMSWACLKRCFVFLFFFFFFLRFSPT